MKRREFVRHGGIAGILAAGTAPAIAQTQPEVRWRMASSFPKSLDTLWGAGEFVAKRVGAALVARNIATMLETAFADRPRDWAPLVYCWRGGKRSGALAHMLNEIGWKAVQLDGGYRSYRRHVLERLADRRFAALSARRGSRTRAWQRRRHAPR